MPWLIIIIAFTNLLNQFQIYLISKIKRRFSPTNACKQRDLSIYYPFIFFLTTDRYMQKNCIRLFFVGLKTSPFSTYFGDIVGEEMSAFDGK